MRKFLVVYEKTRTGFSAYVLDLPGVIATGPSKRVVKKNIIDAVQFHLEGLRIEKLKIPKSSAEKRNVSVCLAGTFRTPIVKERGCA